MATDIKCPGCGHKFPIEQAVGEEYARELREKMISFGKRKEAEYQQKLEELSRQSKIQQTAFEQKFVEENNRLRENLEENIRKSISSDFENKLRILRESNRANEEKLKTARQKELEFLQKEQELKNKEADFEIKIQRTLQQERIILTEQIRKQEMERTAVKENQFHMELRKLQKQLEDQKKLAEEMKRKAEQGSTQLQGEVQELLLEDILKETFPYDVVLEVDKGVEGADCIQIVRNSSGKDCGKIIYESKRAKNWNNTWVGKLKTDMRNTEADMAILVTQTFPRDMERFGSKEGIWICSYAELPSVASVLRNAVMCVSDAKKFEENKGEKMQMLYHYVSSNEFRQQIESIAESFHALHNSIIKEKMFMEKTWKERQKQLEKTITNTIHMYGSMKSILGASVTEIPLLSGAKALDDFAD